MTEQTLAQVLSLQMTALFWTCYHVIGDSDRQELYDGIKIYFADSNIGIDGTILVKDKHKEPYVDHDNDVAFLQISKEDQIKLENSGQKLIPLPLSESVVFGHEMLCKGYRKEDEYPGGLGTNGKIQILTSYKVDNDITIPIVQLYATDVQEGMSGSPVLDVETNKVIGMVDRIYDEEDKKDSNLVMAIPVESLVKTYPDLSKKNRGITLINQFLEVIGLSSSDQYQEFDETWTLPQKNILHFWILWTKRIAFLSWALLSMERHILL